MRTIFWKNKFTHVTELYKELQFLKLNEIYELELAKFMYQLHHHQLPDIYFDQFTKIEKIHSHDTRQCKKALYFLPRVAKSIGKFRIAFRGTKLWSDIDEETKSMHWVSFKKRYRTFLLSKY